MIRRTDQLSLLAIATGIAMMVQPWWSGGFVVGFFVVLISTALQIVVSHVPRRG
jgi:hypothetical protein